MCLSLGSVTLGAATWGNNLLVCPMGASVGPAGGSTGDGVGAALLGTHTQSRTRGELCEDVRLTLPALASSLGSVG